MQVLILCGDVIQAASIRDKINELLESKFPGFPQDGEITTFAAETKTGSPEDTKIFLISNTILPQRLNVVGEALTETLSLAEKQVICPEVL